MAGRIGNKGYSYFSESAYHNLEEAVKLMGQYLDEQKKSHESGKKNEESINRMARYAQELLNLGIQQNEINEKHLRNRQAELETEREQYKAEQKRENEEAKRRRERANEQKRTKIMQQWEKDFQLQTSTASKKEIENQQKLNKIRDDAIKKAEDLRLSEKSRQEILNNAAKKYNEEQRRQRQQASSRSNRETVVNSIFGTTNQDIKDVEDGTYGWKLITRTFAKAVEVFKNAVKESITANYNSTEKTLNIITASNRISWSSGSFQPSKYGFTSNKTYNGYEKINNAINDQLLADGLYNNIANTEVMEAVAKLTSQDGLGLEQAIAKGYQDTVIKYIVPYLDTTSEAFTNVEYLMPRNIKKYSFYSYKCKRTIW